MRCAIEVRLSTPSPLCSCAWVLQVVSWVGGRQGDAYEAALQVSLLCVLLYRQGKVDNDDVAVLALLASGASGSLG